MKRRCILAAVLAEWLLTINYYAVSVWTEGELPLWGLPALLAGFILLNIFRPEKKRYPLRLEVLSYGSDILLLFSIGLILEIAFTAAWLITGSGADLASVLIHLLILVILGGALFWNGILRVYLGSVQLGIKWRIIGALCGWIPLIHLWALGMIIRITRREVREEEDKYRLNQERRGQEICRTRYPVLLVHGVFFRDSKLFNYWGRIPSHLEKNGAQIFYGEHESAASVELCGRQIADRIQEIRRQTGCEKVNLIAHSKGGLDCRYAISCTEAGPYVASLTTVNTPHQGCLFADDLLGRIPQKAQLTIARQYNGAAKRLGDRQPDFLEAVRDLTAEACGQLNQRMPDRPGVYYQSVGSKMNRAASGKFPLNMTYHLVKQFDRDNDGLVTVDSMKWGERFQLIAVTKGRGVSHGDVIDLNRENIKGFDVREFYVQLLRELKEKGL